MAARKRETAVALRRAAVKLIAEQGYDSTSTDDIARAAGVSPRTFFNYFPTKESVVQLPNGLLDQIVVSALVARPPDEDPVTSVAAAAVVTFDAVRIVVEAEDALLLASLRLVFRETALRRIMTERQVIIEDIVWAVMVERGTSSQDLGTRVAVSTTVNLAFLALRRWVESDATTSLQATLARCLLLAPEPARIAAGVSAAQE
ncbi:MAG: helix-turn-helix domain-containing protein [Ilumatobacteraceae bacterium]